MAETLAFEAPASDAAARRAPRASADATARVRTILFLGADAAYLHAFRGALMRELASRGFRIVAVAAVLGDFDPAAFADVGAEFRPWDIRKATLDPLGDLGPLLDLWRILRAERPDVLFAHTVKAVIYGLTLGALAGVPRRTAMIPGLGYAFTATGGWKRRIVGLMARAGYRLGLGAAQMVIFQNTDDRDTLHRTGALPKAVATGLVNGSGVDMSLYAPAPWPPGPPTFLMVARLLRDKGVEEFVEAARMVREVAPDARFVLVGGTDPNPAAVPQAQIDGWVAEGLIEARGRLPDPRPEYAACHVFVLPSYYMEGCPRVNLEAMAMARPLITTDWVGCRETVVDGVNGLRVPVRDAGALARAMLDMIRDMGRARTMGEAGRRLCEERFELGAVTRVTADLVEGRVECPA